MTVEFMFMDDIIHREWNVSGGFILPRKDEWVIFGEDEYRVAYVAHNFSNQTIYVQSYDKHKIQSFK